MFRDAGAVLRDARTRAGMSQADLARRAQVAQPVISAYETGRREPALSTLARLVNATGYELRLDFVPTAVRRGLPDTAMGRRLRRRRRAILAVADRRGAHNVRVFGSVARGDDTGASDVDLLVDLDDGVSLVGLIGLARELTQILGQQVDVVPARSLKPGLAERVVKGAIEL